MTDAFETALLKGIATMLAAGATRVPLTWKETGTYTAEEVGIDIDLVREVTEPSLTLSTYVVSDDVGGEDSVLGLQVRYSNASVAGIRDMVADVFDLLHGRQRGMLGGVTLIAARRTSGTGIGQDRNARLERTENYYLTVAQPTTRRT